MKKPDGTLKLTVDSQDFGTICVCALRYAMGRETYMPDLVRSFVRPLLPKLDSKTLAVMAQDCEFQKRMGAYGHERIDKPGWVRWEHEVNEELERRKADG